MLTRNGLLCLGTNSTSSKNFKKTDGTSQSLAVNTIKSTGTMIVGASNTAPTIDDYTLGEEISTLTATNISVVNAQLYEDGYADMITGTFTNNTAADITVREVGWLANPNSTAVLLAREVITPVTIQPNESKTFTIKVG